MYLKKVQRSIVIHSSQSGRSEKLSQALTHLQKFGVEARYGKHPRNDR